jgi:DDE superfamily endonuclease
MPAHSSYLLQPLDIGCFSPLKAAYRRLVAENGRLSINYIDKPEFLSIYKQARIKALLVDNIRSGFTATGLIPLDLEQVLSRL